MRIKFSIISTIAIILLSSSAGLSQTVTTSLFDTTNSGKDVMVYTMTNANGLQAKVIQYGGTLISLEVPDRDGILANIVKGYNNVSSYVSNPWTGNIIGRYANRIANAKFTLDGVEYILTKNSGAHQLHGGSTFGFNNVIWNGYPYQSDTEAGVKLTHMSLDGEEGYPGNLTCTVTYALTNDNELRIVYKATTDESTVVNFTNHSYFNLAGYNNGNILSHEVMINANWYTYAGSDKIPTGQINSVVGSAGLDFRTSKIISNNMNYLPRGETQYDHNFVLNLVPDSIFLAASAYDPSSGRVMDCYTDQPGLQFYTSDNSAFCLETQHFPDSPNKPHFPSTVLRPGEVFESTTIYQFSTK
ncbi:MAG: galactose mutarotase [Sedimentisphaerales bacterium]|nr:galactose mutarotase [Sedimentisphaerales bacterium]